jgi:hypothetical protein
MRGVVSVGFRVNFLSVSFSHLRQTTNHTNKQTLTTDNVVGILLGFL